MQPTIHLEGKTEYLPCTNPDLHSKCIVGCIFNSVRLSITCEALCIMSPRSKTTGKLCVAEISLLCFFQN
jgi:hypothetical protein